MARNNVMKVGEGEFVQWKGYEEGGKVRPACDSKTKGHWLCVTHGEHFMNQFQKDTHISMGEHRLAWMCHEHGVEVP